MTIANVLTHALEDLEKNNLANQLADAIANIKYAIELDASAAAHRQEQWKAWAVDRASTVLGKAEAVPTGEDLLKLATVLAGFVNDPALDPKRTIQ